MSRIVLLDGNSLAYRAFYALPEEMRTSGGQQTNAVFGFASMLLNTVRDLDPAGAAVAFDLPGPTFRHDRDENYKAQRERAPDTLREQMDLVHELVRALGIKEVQYPGYEADDVIATLATRLADQGMEVVVVTGDRDVLQLVRDPHVKVLYNRRGVSDYVLFDEAAVREKFGVPPERYPFFAALRGDPSDNIPGVPGVGEKTAAKLAAAYPDPDTLFARIDELPKGVRNKLAGYEEVVRKNLELTTLVRDVPLDFAVDDLRLGDIDGSRVRRLFDFLEFYSLKPRLEEAFGKWMRDDDSSTRLRASLSKLEGTKAICEAIGSCNTAERVAFGLHRQEDDDRSRVAAVALVRCSATEDDEPEVAVFDGSALGEPQVASALSELFSGGPPLIMWDAKPFMRTLLPAVDVRTLSMDCKVAAYLLDPIKGEYDCAETLSEHTGRVTELTPAPQDGSWEPSEAEREAAGQALATVGMEPVLRQKIADSGMQRLHDEIETPLVRVLARMEHIGVKVDVERLSAIDSELQSRCEKLQREIWKVAGVEFNISSTPQLREVLFDKLGLPPQRRTKTGYSTDAATLEKLRDVHPIAGLILKWRELDKLRSTFAQGLLAVVGEDGRIHATFNQTVARTGRISSENPNLHNIPVRGEEGKVFRQVFVPEDDWLLVVADYNQIELRCIAHLSHDPGLLAAFRSGVDVHTATAARVFGVDAARVTKEMRERAKMVSYGLAYGMEAYGLGQRLGISTEEAAEILDAYFRAFPRVKEYMEQTVDEARRRGYTVTLLGRRRPLPELSSDNRRIREAGERQAMNAGIQGLAADIFKIALVDVDRALERFGGDARIILQVHDEVIVESRSEIAGEVAGVVAERMENAFELDVPLRVEVGVGTSWADAKP